jgi:hypothetical protein
MEAVEQVVGFALRLQKRKKHGTGGQTMNDLIRRSDSYDHATLSDWYIARVDGSPPVWTDEHIEELLNDFYVIPKDAIPAVNVAEVRHGEWVDMADFEQCSVCKGTRLKEFQSKYGKTIWIRTPYCPNCGAKMESEEIT